MPLAELVWNRSKLLEQAWHQTQTVAAILENNVFPAPSTPSIPIIRMSLAGIAATTSAS